MQMMRKMFCNMLHSPCHLWDLLLPCRDHMHSAYDADKDSSTTLSLNIFVMLFRSTAGVGCKQSLFSVWQVAGALPIAGFHSLVAYRMTYVSFGWPAVLLSPGVAWCMPLIGLLLRTHRSCMQRECMPADKKAL